MRAMLYVCQACANLLKTNAVCRRVNSIYGEALQSYLVTLNIECYTALQKNYKSTCKIAEIESG